MQSSLWTCSLTATSVTSFHHISRNSNEPEVTQRSQWTIVLQPAEQLITASVVWCVNEINFPSNYLGRYQATELQRGVLSISRQGERVDALNNCSDVVGGNKEIYIKMGGVTPFPLICFPILLNNINSITAAVSSISIWWNEYVWAQIELQPSLHFGAL